MSAIVNATPLIALALVDRLDRLQQISGEVIVPTSVYQEVVGRGIERPGARVIAQAQWLQVISPKTAPTIEPLLLGLNVGETDVLLLARERQPDWVVIDEPQSNPRKFPPPNSTSRPLENLHQRRRHAGFRR